MIKLLIYKVAHWLSDPFGQQQLSETHRDILEAVVQTTGQAHQVSHNMKYGRYPLGSSLRRKRVR